MPLPGVLEHLYGYWQSLPRPEQSLVPARFNMLPTDINASIPRLSLLKVQDRYDVQVSMVNTGQNEGWCGPFIGMNAFDLTAPHMRENTALLYENVVNHPCGAIMREEIKAKTGKVRQILSLYLPLSDINGQPRYILSCTDYRRQRVVGKSKVHDRLMASHDHVIDIEFIDIGAGTPDVAFETVTPSQPHTISHTWWDRFVPTLPRWLVGEKPSVKPALPESIEKNARSDRADKTGKPHATDPEARA